MYGYIRLHYTGEKGQYCGRLRIRRYSVDVPVILLLSWVNSPTVSGVHESVSTIAPPTNRRLHELENKEYSPLQAAKLRKKCVIDLYLQ